MKKRLTAEAEQYCLERIGQHNDNLKLWESGYLNATEPEQEEREITVCQLRAARDELIELLGRFCGPQSVGDEHRLRSMMLDEVVKRVVNVPKRRQKQTAGFLIHCLSCSNQLGDGFDGYCGRCQQGPFCEECMEAHIC